MSEPIDKPIYVLNLYLLHLNCFQGLARLLLQMQSKANLEMAFTQIIEFGMSCLFVYSKHGIGSTTTSLINRMQMMKPIFVFEEKHLCIEGK